ncbi:hypothetical protein ACIP9H_33515 [Streptomyces sp. NPDC088732]|uniref:hypothetical protein n=1 Tax=Streptomyces sp. NPDC088732 TaxID=3365879 RepID=UPI0038066DE5
MTVSDAAPYGRPSPNHITEQPDLDRWMNGAESSISLTIGPEWTPVQAMEQAVAMVAMSLPTFLDELPDRDDVCADVQAVLRELVDVTARHKASVDLVAEVVFDGAHVTVSVRDMDCDLPAPEEEPGLYLVHRLAEDVGQYPGDNGGRITWAAVPVHR